MGLWHLGEPAWALIVRSAVIYLVLLVGLRVFGKREVGQFTLFDLVFVLLVANAVQPAMTGRDLSLGGVFIIIATLLTLNFAVSRIRIRFPVLDRLLESRSVVVARDGAWDEAKLKREGITADEAVAALREHGIDSIGETKLVVLEADGSLSVVPKDPKAAAKRRRHVRFIKHG
ncbi:MAG TPA: YetF domain-containing protein [Actinomycetota bacterium]|nr:YetF domain-containing protein [Actinomycetota bacterium]